MKKVVKKQIGKTVHNFQVSGENLWECMMEAQKLSFQNVYKCRCGCDDLYLKAYVTENGGYKYLKICCPSCKSYVNFGQQKQSPDTFFIRKNDDGTIKWEKYEEYNTQDNNQSGPKINNYERHEPDDGSYNRLMSNNGFDI